MMVPIARLALTAAVFVLTACSSITADSPAGSLNYGLIQAQHSACQQEGISLASYLDTGRPTSLDATWGNARQNVLGHQGEQRALLIRQYADGYITQCDAQEAKREEDARQVQYEAARQAEQARQEALKHTSDVAAAAYDDQLHASLRSFKAKCRAANGVSDVPGFGDTPSVAPSEWRCYPRISDAVWSARGYGPGPGDPVISIQSEPPPPTCPPAMFRGARPGC